MERKEESAYKGAVDLIEYLLCFKQIWAEKLRDENKLRNFSEEFGKKGCKLRITGKVNDNEWEELIKVAVNGFGLDASGIQKGYRESLAQADWY